MLSPCYPCWFSHRFCRATVLERFTVKLLTHKRIQEEDSSTGENTTKGLLLLLPFTAAYVGVLSVKEV